MADITITPANVLAGAAGNIVSQFLAGAQIEAGYFLYLDNSSIWQLVDADSATGTETTRIYGVALNHAYTGQPVAVDIFDNDLTIGGTVVVGTTYVASTNPGKICPRADLASGDYVVNLGVATTTGKLNLLPTAAGAPI